MRFAQNVRVRHPADLTCRVHPAVTLTLFENLGQWCWPCLVGGGHCTSMEKSHHTMSKARIVIDWHKILACNVMRRFSAPGRVEHFFLYMTANPMRWQNVSTETVLTIDTKFHILSVIYCCLSGRHFFCAASIICRSKGPIQARVC